MESPDALRDLAHALRGTTGELRLDRLSRALYATDGSMYQKMPLGVFVPRSADDVVALATEARRLGLPILARGCGSSLAGQTVNEAVVVDFSRHLNRVLEIDAEARRVRVEPGLVLDTLSAQIAPLGLMVGPDPASSSRATLGGMVGNNATGTHSLVHGNTIHHVLGLDVVLDDGTAARFGPTGDAAWSAMQRQGGRVGEIARGLAEVMGASSEIVRRDTARHWRRNSGYRLEHLLTGAASQTFSGEPGGGVDAGPGGDVRNLARLFAGSEGTLGLTTAIDLALVERPRRTVLGVAHFTSLDAALRSVPAMLETGPSAIELFDDYAVRAARNSPGFGARMTFVSGDPGAILITEYEGYDDDAAGHLADRLDRLESVLRTHAQGFYALVRATDAADIARVWSVRKEGLGIIMSARGDLKPIAFIEDASVPPEHLADYIAALLKMLEETGTPVALYAHASAGCLHVRPFINTKDATDVAKMARIAEGSMALVRDFGGTVSSEHADGRARSWLNPGLLGPALYDVNVRVKRLFDPENRLNPGNVVDAGPMTEPLRRGPTTPEITPTTTYDWTAEGGFVAAVEQCNGNGACRKLDAGVMCPSFMATREERDSTRGRANVLRLALSGQLPGGLDAPEIADAMDLCVSCKACKTECPSNVDMTKMKADWLAHRHRTTRPSLRTRLIAFEPKLVRRMTPAMRHVAAWGMRPGGVASAVRRRAMARLGFDPSRDLPPIARETFTEWAARQTWRSASEAGKPEVVVFADTFTNYHHPEIGRAAATWLDRAGYRVVVSDPKACCGRPMLSKGMLDAAKAEAENAVARLHPHAAAGRVIVGLEPSCVLTFGDEFRSLLPGDARVDALAAASMLFEDFVAREADAGRLDGLAWAGGGEKVILHGHCHQKALVGTAGSAAALRLAGYDVTVLDTSCCGMAGSFGYEAEHAEVSRAMAERRLLPAVRAAAPSTHVAAPGTSCREQIGHHGGRVPDHPAVLLLRALGAEVPA